MKELTLNVELVWKCKNCGHRQEIQNDGNEEWQYHCGDTMSMLPVRWFSAKEVENV